MPNLRSSADQAAHGDNIRGSRIPAGAALTLGRRREGQRKDVGDPRRLSRLSRLETGLRPALLGTFSPMRPDLPQGPFWELLGIMLIVAFPTIPVMYLFWTTLKSGQRESASASPTRMPRGDTAPLSRLARVAGPTATN